VDPPVIVPIPLPTVPGMVVISIPASTMTTNNAEAFTISGACIDGTLVVISGDVSEVDMIQPAGQKNLNCTDSKFSFVIGKSAGGFYGFAITQANGRATSQPVNISWNRDIQAPAAPQITNPASNPLNSGGSEIIISGVCENGATVVLTGDANRAVSCSNLTFSFAIAATQDGDYSYQLTQADIASNLSSPSLVAWHRDASLPAMPVITSPATPAVHSHGNSLVVSGSCTTDRIVKLSGDISPSDVLLPASGVASMRCAGSAFSFTVRATTDGSRQIDIFQTNSVNGNSSGKATINWVRDTQIPALVVFASPAVSPFSSGANSLIIAGSCEAGAQISLTGDEVQAGACSGAESFSFSMAGTIDKIYTYSLVQVDLAGNASNPATQSWIRDTSSPPDPVITTPASSTHLSNVISQVIAGSCETGRMVFLSGDLTAAEVTGPVAASRTQLCADSIFSFTVTKARDGAFILSVLQQNVANDHESASASVIWTLDTLAPTAPEIVVPAIKPYVTGADTITISGNCEAAAVVTLTGSDTQAQNCTGDGKFNFLLSAAVDGSYFYHITQTDIAGNSSAASDMTWMRDSSTPVAPSITAPASSTIYNNASSLVVAGGCITGNIVHLGGAVVAADVASPFHMVSTNCSSSGYSFTIEKASDGVYDLTILQEYPANGHLSSNAQLTWVKDSLSPLAPGLSSPGINPFSSGGTSLTITGSCEFAASVRMTGDSAQSQSCGANEVYSFTVSKFIDQAYVFNIRQEDLAGNQSSSLILEWTRDTTIPLTPNILVPETSPYLSNLSSLTVSGECEVGDVLTLGGDVTAAEVISPVGELNQNCIGSAYTYIIRKIADGNYTFLVFQTNSNDLDSASSSTTWLRDTQAPLIQTLTSPIVNPVTAPGNLDISGNCELDSTVVLAGAQSGSANCAVGSFAFTLNETVDGIYNFTVVQTDAAGNSSSPLSLQWTRDSGIPATPTISVPAANPFVSNSASLVVSGGCDANFTVVLAGDFTADDVLNPLGKLTQKCSNAGTFAFTVAKAMDSTYAISITQSNGGSSSAAAVRTWVRDTAAPIVTIGEHPADPNLSKGGTFKFTADDALANLECKLGAASYVSCTSPLVWTSIPNGTQTISIRGTDAAGNVGEPAVFSWIQSAYDTIALYHFDGGATTDGSLYSGSEKNNVTSVGAVSTATAKIGGGAQDFESTTPSYLFAADNQSQDLVKSTMTVEGWVRFESLPASGSYMTIMSKMGILNDYGWQLRLVKSASSGRNYLAFQASLDGKVLKEVLSTRLTISSGVWYHVAATWNLGSVKFYFNGVSKGSGTIGTAGTSVIYQSTAPLRIGSVSMGGSYFDGIMDEVRLSQKLRWTASFIAPTAAFIPD
jgi:hypothetical protein